MSFVNRIVGTVTSAMNAVAASAVVVMMLLICADVALRYFRLPIPGTYELVGFLGALAASFALAQTSVERGHIAVDFLVQKFSQRAQTIIDGINAAVGAVMFGFICRAVAAYAADLKAAGEVSMTLEMPTYPIVYGIAAGFAMLTAVLVVRTAETAVAVMHRPATASGRNAS